MSNLAVDDPKPRPRGRRAWTIVISLIIVCTLAFKYLSSTHDLTSAIIKGDVSKARWALRFGADVEHLQRWGWGRTNFGESRLTLAAKKGNPEMLALLIDWGADVNKRDGFNDTPLLAVQYSGNLPAVKLLVAAGAKLPPAGSGSRELNLAIGCGHLELVRYLLDQGVSVNAPSQSSYPPVCHAARLGKPDMVRLLLERGATPIGHSTDGREMSARKIAEDEIGSMRSRHEMSRKKEPSPFQAESPIVTDEDIEKAVQPWREIIELIDAHTSQAQ
jgi:hypothetical protein